jgi:prevent-host-death family protein
MKSMSAKDAKNGFGLLLDTARAEPVTIEKHGRRVAVVLSVEKYERLLKERIKAVRGAGPWRHRKREGDKDKHAASEATQEKRQRRALSGQN